MCEYCADILGGRKELQSIDGEETESSVRLFNYYNGAGTVLEVKNEYAIDDIEINYCPICGRNLKKQQQTPASKMLDLLGDNF